MSKITRNSLEYLAWPGLQLSLQKKMGYFGGIVQYLPDLCACFRYSMVSDMKIITPKAYIKNIYIKKWKTSEGVPRSEKEEEEKVLHGTRADISSACGGHDGPIFFQKLSVKEPSTEGQANHNPPSPIHLCHLVWVRGVRNEGIKLGVGKGGWGATMLV